MATYPAFSAALAAALVAAHSGLARLGSDLRDDLETIPAGGARFQLAGGTEKESSEASANARRPVVAFEVIVHYRLAPADSERDWTEGTAAVGFGLEAVAATLRDPATYRALAQVYDVGDPDTLPADAFELDPDSLERIGDVCTFSVAGRVTLVP